MQIHYKMQTSYGIVGVEGVTVVARIDSIPKVGTTLCVDVT